MVIKIILTVALFVTAIGLIFVRNDLKKRGL
ncbi:MAG: hypothetical protein Ta2B_04060 [Termitinemataceae bacterium]|nr:MAG: hypothetical protein Ta2B_04060 [Termitinemataceae bacterium]